ncbi:MAG: NUDIX domain-containing protein [Candidatus Heimdallarchaeota archaeon]|nr:NUDIX domain-containing protein [Candidatus Heimdallarchaeota archaeon]MCK4954041.1 NUDIX domain-containing protein [Candidatus Heimdallarchaeota archaeon]
MEQKKILAVVVAGIKNNNNWLLIKRERGDYQQKWALVGGKIQFNETIQDAITREIAEETGLNVKWEGIKAILNERLMDKRNGETVKQFIIFLCQTAFKEGEIKPTEEGELKWFSEFEIEENKERIIPSDYYMLRELMKRENAQSIFEVKLIKENNELSLGFIEEYNDSFY